MLELFYWLNALDIVMNVVLIAYLMTRQATIAGWIKEVVAICGALLDGQKQFRPLIDKINRIERSLG